jgi:oligopeptide/dipeptide ABC transporter ATP-binding protein
VKAVDGVSLTIAPGETVGLVGESGCGKTTLARTILRLDPAHSGEVRFEDKDLLAASGQALRRLHRDMQVVFQDPFASLNPRMTVEDIITEGLLDYGIIKARARKEAGLRLLHDVGLDPDARHRFPHEFSGGQRQRISIARAISLRPKLVICDEAVSALDVSVQAQILNLLMDLREQYELSYLFISHDLSVIRHLSHRTAVMYLGRIVEIGPTREVIDRPRHPYTQALISAIPRAGEEKHDRIVLEGDVPSPAKPPPGCPFHPRCPYAIDTCRTQRPELETPDEPAESKSLVACLRKDDQEVMGQ